MFPVFCCRLFLWLCVAFLQTWYPLAMQAMVCDIAGGKGGTEYALQCISPALPLVQQPWYIVSKANSLPNTLVIIPTDYAETLGVLWCYQPRLAEVSWSVSISNFWHHWRIFERRAWLGCNQGDNWHALNCGFRLTLYQAWYSCWCRYRFLITWFALFCTILSLHFGMFAIFQYGFIELTCVHSYWCWCWIRL